MYLWTIIVCIASLTAGVLGFSGVAGSASGLFQLLFFTGLFVALLSPFAGKIALIWADFLAHTEDVRDDHV